MCLISARHISWFDRLTHGWWISSFFLTSKNQLTKFVNSSINCQKSNLQVQCSRTLPQRFKFSQIATTEGFRGKSFFSLLFYLWFIVCWTVKGQTRNEGVKEMLQNVSKSHLIVFWVEARQVSNRGRRRRELIAWYTICHSMDGKLLHDYEWHQDRKRTTHPSRSKKRERGWSSSTYSYTEMTIKRRSVCLAISEWQNVNNNKHIVQSQNQKWSLFARASPDVNPSPSYVRFKYCNKYWWLSNHVKVLFQLSLFSKTLFGSGTSCIARGLSILINE